MYSPIFPPILILFIHSFPSILILFIHSFPLVYGCDVFSNIPIHPHSIHVMYSPIFPSILILFVHSFPLVYGCDVFFNAPTHPNPIKYTYQLINVPVQIMMFGPGQLVKVTCDWMKHFLGPLQQGWRLAEIFWDQGKKESWRYVIELDMNENHCESWFS